MINVLYSIQKRFPLELNDLNEEYGKLGVSRIFIGIVIFSNAIQLASESRFYFETYDEFYYGLIFSALTFSLESQNSEACEFKSQLCLPLLDFAW